MGNILLHATPKIDYVLSEIIIEKSDSNDGLYTLDVQQFQNYPKSLETIPINQIITPHVGRHEATL